MSLDVYLTQTDQVEVFSANITHNLGTMAEAADIYLACWHPEEIGVTKAWQLIPLLRDGLRKLKADPEKYKAYDDPDGWGTYSDFVLWIERYLASCKEFPEANVSVSR